MSPRRLRHSLARSAFAGFCFPPEMIVLSVRWYLRFALSYRDVEEFLAERGIQVDHTTVYRLYATKRGPRPRRLAVR
jgi:transposase, IS6 family